MSDDTPRLRLGQMADAQELDAMAVNDALIQLDAFTDIYLLGQFVNTPPTSPADGDMYLLGGAPTGAWSGYAYKLAYCIDGGWRFYVPFNGLRAYVAASHGFLVYAGGNWIDANALLSAAEVSVASAATCDLGAAASLFVAITGTTAITSFGIGTSLVRFVRFGGALTLTYNATSLILPGAANITTAAGDSAIFASDGSGNWRCRSYVRANGVPLNVTSVTGSGAMVLNAGPQFSGAIGIGMTPVNAVDITQSQNAASQVAVLNSHAGSAASAAMVLNNGSDSSGLFQRGTGFTTSGMNHARGLAVYGNYDVSIVTGQAQPIYLGINGSEVARLTGTGLGVSAGNNPNFNFLAYTPGSSQSGYQAGNSNTGAGSTTGAFYGVDTAGNGYIAVGGGFALKAIAGGSGGVQLAGGATSWSSISDERLKDWSVAQPQWRDAIRGLWVGAFDRYADFSKAGEPVADFGLRAQQAFQILPPPLRDRVIHPGAADTDVWTASAEPLALLALWGAGDLYALVEALAARVTELEARHAAG